MAATISITDQDVFTALRTFLLLILPTGTKVIQAQDNRVAIPKGKFVAMTARSNERLATNTGSYTDPGTNPGGKGVLTPSKFGIQLDFYGDDSAKWAATTQALMRDGYAFDNFPTGIKPLYADDPVQIPLINGEQQYEQRWKLEVMLQINPVVTVAQDFSDALSVNIINVEATYPV